MLSAGSLDPTFGQGGVVLVNDASQFDTTTVASVMQPDGKAVLVGTAQTAPGPAGAVVRLDTDGQRDATFGDAGAVTLADPGYASFTAAAVAIDAGGNLLVVGTAVRRAVRPMAAIARIKPDGSLDAAFGDSGSVTIPFGDGAQVKAIAVGRDGQIVVAGANGTDVTLHSGSMAFACLNADGSIKPSFGRHGYEVVPFSLGRRHPDVIPSCAFATAVLPDGRIVGVGGGYLVEATRLTADGVPDPTFGRRGRAVLAGQYGQFNAMTIAPDGSLFATGTLTPSPYGPPEKPGVVTGEFDVGGQPDAHFGRNGAAVTYVGARRYRPATANAGGIALTDDGQVLVSGGVVGARATGAFLARYNADGSLDAGFGSQGVVVGPAAVSSPLILDGITGAGLLPEPDGGFVVPFDLSVFRAPYVSSFLPLDLHAARFAADGSPDASFGAQGVADVAGPSGAGRDSVRQVVAAPDGSFYVSGFAGNDYFVGRYHSDGTAETSFGTGGRIAAVSSGLAADPDGSVSVSETLEATGQILIQRYRPDGTLDTTYGSGGMAPLGFDGGILSLPDGSLLGQSTSLNSTYSYSTSLAVIDPAGVPGAFVQKTFDIHGGGEAFNAAVVTPDGKVLALVFDAINGVASASYTLERYNADLTPDATFGTNGVLALTGLPFEPLGENSIRAMAVSPDGSIYLLGGPASSNGQNPPGALVRLDPAGVMDATFGSGGQVAGVPATGSTLLVQDDGKVIATSVAGSTMSLVRYNPDGTPDVAFGAGGRADIDLGEAISSTPNVPAVSLAIEQVGGQNALLAAGTLLATPPLASGQSVGPSEGFVARVEL